MNILTSETKEIVHEEDGRPTISVYQWGSLAGVDVVIGDGKQCNAISLEWHDVNRLIAVLSAAQNS